MVAFEEFRALEEGAAFPPWPSANEQVPTIVASDTNEELPPPSRHMATAVAVNSHTASSHGSHDFPSVTEPTGPPSDEIAVDLADHIAGGWLSEAQLFGDSLSSSSRPPWHPPPTHTGSEPSSPSACPAASAPDADLALQFSCPICLDVCEDAVETPCCHNLFCRQCLLSKDHRINDCPICKTRLDPDSVQANVPVRRIIADFPCTCRFDGCGLKLWRRDRVQHEAQCDFMLMRCRFSADCAPLLRRHIVRHEESECPCRPVQCNCCGRTVPYNMLERHLDRECSNVRCRCEHCEALIRRADMGEHLQAHCPMVSVECNLVEDETQVRCDYRCRRNQLVDHQSVCTFRPAQCRHEVCTHVTTARLLEAHEETCQWRRIPCPDCDVLVHVNALQEHLESDCPDHMVSCPFSIYGCLELIPRRLVNEHLQSATSSHLSQLCSAVASRDLEIDSLKMEMAHMRHEFESRLSRLERRAVHDGTLHGLLGGPAQGQRASSSTAAVPLPPPPPPVGSSYQRAPSVQAAAGTGQGPEALHVTDVHMGPSWDRDFSISPPLQPTALFREGGISQVPVLMPPRVHISRSPCPFPPVGPSTGMSQGATARSNVVHQSRAHRNAPLSVPPVPVPRPSAAHPVPSSGLQQYTAFGLSPPNGASSAQPLPAVGAHGPQGAQTTPPGGVPLGGDAALNHSEASPRFQSPLRAPTPGMALPPPPPAIGDLPPASAIQRTTSTSSNHDESTLEL